MRWVGDRVLCLKECVLAQIELVIVCARPSRCLVAVEKLWGQAGVGVVCGDG